MNPLMSDFADLSLQKKRKVPKGARMRQMQRRSSGAAAAAAARKRDCSKEKEGEESIRGISLHQERLLTAQLIPCPLLWAELLVATVVGLLCYFL